MKRLNHPNILQMFHYFEDHKRYMLVEDVVEGTELFAKIINQEYIYTENQIAFILRQLLSSVNHMHDNHIIHRDIKLENIMVDESDMPGITLIDFGTSVKFMHNQ